MGFDRTRFTHAYPFTPHYLDLSGLKYHYVDEGPADAGHSPKPPSDSKSIVCVHGNPTWSFYFREIIREFRDQCRVIAPDHVGCGLSDKPDDTRYEYVLERRVGDLENLLNRVVLPQRNADATQSPSPAAPITLVLHDWGGMIGLAAALRHVEHIGRIVLLNTAAFLPPHGKQLPLRLRMIRNHPLFGAATVRGLNAFAGLAARMAVAAPLPRDVRQALTAPYDSWRNRIATLRFVQDIPLAPGDRSYELAHWVDSNLHRLKHIPMLILWGRRDFVFDRDYLDEWRRRFPAAEVHAFPDAGHYVLEDKPRECVDLIREFLTRDAPPSTPSNRSRDASEQPSQRPQTTSSPTDESANIARHLSRVAAQRPNDDAILVQTPRINHGNASFLRWTFEDLNRETDRYAHGLSRRGVRRGIRTILMIRPSREFFALVFALFKIGAVPVLVDPGMGRNKMVQCLASTTPEAFIGVPLAHALRVLNHRAFHTVRLCVTVGRRWFWGGPRLDQVRADTIAPFEPTHLAPDEPAAILFTTGSTGPAKGVVYTHAIFDAQIRLLRDSYAIEPGEIDLATFPLFALFDPALGMTSVIPDMDSTRPAEADPRKLIRAIQESRATSMFASPALLDRLGTFAQANGIKFPTLRRAISAGAPVRPSVLARFATIVPDQARILTPYGATEALPVATISAREVGELAEASGPATARRGVCVGRPVPGVSVRIIRIDDRPIQNWSADLELRTGQIGEIAVQGPIVTRQYWADEQATKLAKIIESPDSAGLERGPDRFWHRMGDVGFLDEAGRLWMCGRKSHRVITEAGTLFTIPCEAVFNQHPRVSRTALVGVGPAPRRRPVLCVELMPGDGQNGLDELTRELLALGDQHEHTRGIKTILYHPRFPVDIRHNAKIFREKLALWAARKIN